MIRGWAVALVLIGLLVPFLVGVVDLVARTRRHDAPLGPAFRALRRRIGFWALLGAMTWLATVVGFLPGGPAVPLPPHGPTATDWPLAGLATLTCAGLAAWFTARRRLVPRRPTTRGEELAGYTAALAGLGVLGVLVAIVHPLALVLLVPSLYAWLWLPAGGGPRGLRDVLFGVGLAGAAAGAVSIGPAFSSERGRRSTSSTGHVGYVRVDDDAVVLAWAAVTAQLGALAVGRYGPYAGGAAAPAAGTDPQRRASTALAVQSRREVAHACTGREIALAARNVDERVGRRRHA